jgi:ketosteroid isomerase-like protein
VPVASANIDIVGRFIEVFNRDGEQWTGDPPPAEMYELFVPEPVIVPVRASMEDIEYSGPTALEDFRSATSEVWSRLQVEPEEVRELDRERVLLVGTLIGTGLESGAEVRQRCAWLMVFRDGKIAEARTYLSVSDALEAVAQ